MTEQTPAILRISRGRFDPATYETVRETIEKSADYLVPAIRRLPGLLHYTAATSRDGVTTQISVWTSEEAGMQMSSLPEMRDRARGEAEAVGIVFDPIIQLPINWTIEPEPA